MSQRTQAAALAVIISVTFYACASSRTTSVSGDVQRAGLFYIASKITRDEPQVPQGKVFRPRGIEFLEEARAVPATLGTSFGFEYIVSARPWRPFVRVKVVFSNPPITNPSTGETFVQSGFVYSAPTNQVLRAVYSFDKTWELAPGTWTISIFHEDTLLASESFDVVVPP